MTDDIDQLINRKKISLNVETMYSQGMLQEDTGESPSPPKPKPLEVINDEEGHEDESQIDAFDERYLDSINESVKTLSPDKIRVRD
jgi:hypothetical protein